MHEYMYYGTTCNCKYMHRHAHVLYMYNMYYMCKYMCMQCTVACNVHVHVYVYVHIIYCTGVGMHTYMYTPM